MPTLSIAKRRVAGTLCGLILPWAKATSSPNSAHHSAQGKSVNGSAARNEEAISVRTQQKPEPETDVPDRRKFKIAVVLSHVLRAEATLSKTPSLAKLSLRVASGGR
jgi:hypothetical protein